jgi:hypothetical protein
MRRPCGLESPKRRTRYTASAVYMTADDEGYCREDRAIHFLVSLRHCSGVMRAVQPTDQNSWSESRYRFATAAALAMLSLVVAGALYKGW